MLGKMTKRKIFLSYPSGAHILVPQNQQKIWATNVNGHQKRTISEILKAAVSIFNKVFYYKNLFANYTQFKLASNEVVQQPLYIY